MERCLKYEFCVQKLWGKNDNRVKHSYKRKEGMCKMQDSVRSRARRNTKQHTLQDNSENKITNMEEKKVIQNYEMKKVAIKDIKLDSANPNKMSEEQITSLRYSLNKFGQLKPIIIDQTNTICDGEQQYKACLSEGIEEIQVIQVECTPVQRRLIRQTMNKLHGEHEPTLDLEEYNALLQEGQLKELGLLLAKPEQELKDFMTQIENPASFSEKEFDETISTEIECPKCGYKW